MVKKNRKKTGSKPGRKRIDGGLQKRRNISMSDAMMDKAKLAGAGNASEGIRAALMAYKFRKK